MKVNLDRLDREYVRDYFHVDVETETRRSVLAYIRGRLSDEEDQTLSHANIERRPDEKASLRLHAARLAFIIHEFDKALAPEQEK